VVIVTCVTVALYTLGPRVQYRVIGHVSTNLHNLSHGHFGTLLESAFVIDAGPIYVWLPGLVCLLGVAELMWVAAGLTAGVELGWLPVSVSRATDVGMSYGATAVLGSLVLASTDLVVATAAGMAGAAVAECALMACLRRRSAPKVDVGAVAPESNAREARSGHRL
jgi:hypothetical protein